MKEIFKTIESSSYSISNIGNIRNDKTGRIIKTYINNSGYRIVNLFGKCHCVHRLVAKAFVPNPNNLSDVNHKDENKLNNNANNLEWLSHKDNMNYGSVKKKISITLNNKDDFGDKVYIGKLASYFMKCLSPTLKQHNRTIGCGIIVNDVEYPTVNDASKVLGITKARISQLKKSGNASRVERIDYKWVPSPVNFNN